MYFLNPTFVDPGCSYPDELPKNITLLTINFEFSFREKFALKFIKMFLNFQPQNYSIGDLPTKDELPLAGIGDGLKTAIWQLAVALIFKCIITVFTFGLKVRY